MKLRASSWLAAILCGWGGLALADERVPGSVERSEKGFLSRVDGAELALVPAARYAMGDAGGRYDERPELVVELSAFLIERREVSNSRFDRFVRATGYVAEGPWRRAYRAGEEDLPVRLVSWNDAAAYAAWAKRRLPTEAEWEAACGPNRYAYGEAFSTGRSAVGLPGPVSVREARDESRFGVLHLSGNVREWVADWHDRLLHDGLAWAWKKRKTTETLVDPRGPEDGAEPELRFVETGVAPGKERSTRKVVKGASFAARWPEQSTKARRTGHAPDQWYEDVGFRTAISLELRP
ncbi:MAG: SUMF1/EgtB/PvdO family nonheme iron enzyme [Deltaproteobacteria bacterium]|nr:SUMF1/EgtB/PvdO family nonheme iron enzyme [Deltaproteobacteria bacterium]